MEWWSLLSSDQKLTVWVAIGSAVLGGTVSMATSWLLTMQANRHALKVRRVDRAERGAFLAQQALVKLLQLGNSAISLKGTIDDQFDEAAESGHEDLLPVQKVQKIEGLETDFENFLTEELAFLLHSHDADLLGELLVFEKRVISDNHAVATYNRMRTELTDRLEEGAVAVDHAKGTVLSSELKGREAILVDVRVGALQGLLGTIMERLSREVVDSRKLLGRLNAAAKQEYGDLFPSLKFEDPEKC